MIYLNRLPRTHEERTARWLGECHNQIALQTLGFPTSIRIANRGAPLWAHDGVVYGALTGGGFSSLSDLIAEATTGGKRQQGIYGKVGTLAVSAAQASLWNVGNAPAAPGNPSVSAATPSGLTLNNLATGSLGFATPSGTDTLHVTTVSSQASAAPNTLLLYDRLWMVGGIAHGQITPVISVTSSLDRYKTAETAPGNFAFLEVTTILTATAQNLTMSYRDQNLNVAENAPALAMIVSSAVTRLPHAQFFIPLNSPDLGVRAIASVTWSASNQTGVSALVIGHPLLFIPQPLANTMAIVDGINSAFSLPEMLPGCCPALLELKGVATATTYTTHVVAVSG